MRAEADAEPGDERRDLPGVRRGGELEDQERGVVLDQFVRVLGVVDLGTPDVPGELELANDQVDARDIRRPRQADLPLEREGVSGRLSLGRKRHCSLPDELRSDHDEAVRKSHGSSFLGVGSLSSFSRGSTQLLIE